MSQLNEVILKYLDEHNEVNTLGLSKIFNEDHQKIIGALKSIQAHGNLIIATPVSEKRIEITEEGKLIAENGSHEANIYNAITENGSPQAEVMKLPNARIGFSKAMSAGWILVDKSVNPPLVKRKVPTIVDIVQDHLQQIILGDLSKISEKEKQEYKKRKLVQEVVVKSFDLEKGPEFKVTLDKLETDLTTEMLLSGSWQSLKFKDYNFDALGSPLECGYLHPLLKVRSEFRQIFLEMGFSEMPTNNYIENSFWNFDALFQPQQHPARDAHDTFFISDPKISGKFPQDYLERVKKVHSKGGYGSQGYGYDWKIEEAQKNLLRTHTTAVSARMLYKVAQLKEFKPIKLFSIDKVFRNETLDATHLAEFHQVEGVIADYNLTLGDLIGVFAEFFKKLGITQLCRCVMDSQSETQNGAVDRLKRLYPAVNEEKTPLPRAWSPKEKYNYIGLSQNNLRVHYKGHGKTHRDAASVQATHPIPASCGLYYFEVKIVSKGRDGYMGIGLSAQGVNMNRLPGWDKQSYGYHGDDGHSFCSSGTGQPYGPTFTTGDVIGCGVNLIDNTCFYTKNGHNLGTAFTDLPPNLYPTVGLQTPGEVVDANFGQEPFMFDIEDMMKELRSRTRLEINNFSIPESQGEWQAILNKMVSTYLIHHGYCNTAEAFAHITEQPFNEDIGSIKNRQKILKLVLAGRMGEAIEKTSRLYPGLLENNQNLLFMLKCRQFVEMVNGSDIETCNKKSIGAFSPSFNTSPRPSSPVQTSVIQSTKSFSNKGRHTVEEMNQQNVAHNGTSCINETSIINTEDSDVEMDTSEEVQNGHGDTCMNGKNGSTNGYQNGTSHGDDLIDNSQELICCDNEEEDMDVDFPCRKSCTKPAVERILDFGRELYSMSQRLNVDKNSSELNQKMLEDAFSLLAYSNPWASPVGWQLEPSQRESVCASLNSAILESNNKPRRPPLEVAIAHAQELVRLMSSTGLGSCAFASLIDILDQ